MGAMTFSVGLTGGIGCGKTTVADMFAALGATLVDTDLIAHRLTAPQGSAMAAISAEFGPQFVAADGSLDRPRMRELVFNEASARARLEAILHPRIVQGALATQDVDLLWDARRKVRFITEMKRSEVSMLQVLQRADSTFQRKEGQNEKAINAKGFEVDFLRRMAEGDDPHPFRFSADEDDLWPVQAVRASVLTNAPRFEHVVASATGHMAMMRTIAPATFVEFKRWMADKAPAREPLKRNRDRRQADIIQGLLDQGMLVS